MEPNWTDGHDVLNVGNNTGPTDDTSIFRSSQTASTSGFGSSASGSGGSSGNQSDKSSAGSSPRASASVARPLEPVSPADDGVTNPVPNVLDTAASIAAEDPTPSAAASTDATGSGSISARSGLDGHDASSGMDVNGGYRASTEPTTATSTRGAAPPVHPQGTMTVTDDAGRSVLIVLLRNDLRVQDNPLFTYAHRDRAPPPPAWMDQHINWDPHRGIRLGQAFMGPGLPNHTLQGVDGGGVFADEWNLASQSQYILPLYVFDERVIELSGLPNYQRQGPEARTPTYGFWKTGGFRVRFIVECIADLRQNLIKHGSDLLIRFGKTEEVIDELVSSFHAQGDSVEGVWMQKEAATEEVDVERRLAKTLHSRRVPLNFTYGQTLIHPADLPFDIKETPDVFTPFRKRVESLGKRMVRSTAELPSRFKPFPPQINDFRNYSFEIDPFSDINGHLNGGHTHVKPPHLPTYAAATGQVKEQSVTMSWDDLMKSLLQAIIQPQAVEALNDYTGLTSRHTASAFPFRGGETSALERLEWYFIRGRMSSGPAARDGLPPVARYKQTRNNLLGSGYSTKMSPFLAYGCVSARQIWEVLDKLEERLGEDQSTYWVRFELMWRDYFFLVAAKFGDLLYALGGFETVTDPRQADKKKNWWNYWDPHADKAQNEVTRLLEARTGIPFIDANVTELRESGFMSNRGRQNVASFLSKDLQCDWRVGAEFFASHLIDYDATSNYGNWQYVAGVGNDPRASRQFNTIKQCKDYDAHGDYVKTWLPVLRNLPAEYVHTPWLLSDEERWQYGVKPSVAQVTAGSYPSRPMVEFDSWKKHYDRRDGSGSKMRGNPLEKVKDVTERFRRMKMYHSHAHAHNHNHNHNHEHHHHHHHHRMAAGGRATPPNGTVPARWKPTVGLWERNHAASELNGYAQGNDSASSGSGSGRGSGSGNSRNDGSNSTLETGTDSSSGLGPLSGSAPGTKASRLSCAPGSQRNFFRREAPEASMTNNPPSYTFPIGTPSYSKPLPGSARLSTAPVYGAARSASHYTSTPSSDAYDVMGSDDAGQYDGHKPAVSLSQSSSSLPHKLDRSSRWGYFGAGGDASSGSESPAVPSVWGGLPASPGSAGGRNAYSALNRRSHVPSSVPSASRAPMVPDFGYSPEWPSNARAQSTGPGNRNVTASASAIGPGATSRVSIGRNGVTSSSSAASPLPPSRRPFAQASPSLPPNPYITHNYNNDTMQGSGSDNSRWPADPAPSSRAPWTRR